MCERSEMFLECMLYDFGTCPDKYMTYSVTCPDKFYPDVPRHTPTCSDILAVLAAAESRTGQARLPVCRVSWAKQTPS